MEKIENSTWFDLNRTLSYNAMINIILSARGPGKTYSVKKRIINRFIKHGEQFVLIRRYKDDIGQTKLNQFFADIESNNEFEDHELKVINKEFWIDGELAGWAFALSQSANVRSVSFPDVGTIFYDEFITPGSQKYIKNEAFVLFDLLSTITRLRDDVRIILAANAISLSNPVFRFLDIRPKLGQEFTTIERTDTDQDGLVKTLRILIQIFDGEGHKAKSRISMLGLATKGTQWARYAIENEFLSSNGSFIKRRPPKLEPLFNIEAADLSIGVWRDNKLDELHISNKMDPTRPTLTYNTDIYTEDNALIKKYRDNNYTQYLQIMFTQGNVYYTNQFEKELAFNIYIELGIL